MKRIYNAFVYCVYLMDVKLHYLSNRINPGFLIWRLPCVKKKWKKKEQNPIDEYNKLFVDKTHGLSISVSQGITAGLFGIILFSSFKTLNHVLNFYVFIPGFYFIIFGCVSILTGYLMSWRNFKYLDYFEEFEKWTRSQKRKYVLISFLVIIATIAYFFMSLMCC